MTSRPGAKGDLLLVAFPSHDPGMHEQEGRRPALVVGVPSGAMRYPVLIVAPLTTRMGPWVALNPTLYPTINVLSRPSVVLLDQMRAIDARRVVSYLDRLTAEAFRPIEQGLQQLFGF